MTKILMVCLGNICRSPLAEGILKSKIDATKVYVDSAGTAGYHVGNPPDPRSINTAMNHGINIANQRCRQFAQEDFEKFDAIYVMDNDNFIDLMAQANSSKAKSKVKLLLEETTLTNKEVPDPYYGGEDGFETVFQLISIACENIATKTNGDGT